jgi:hypothetical protein
MEALEYPFKKIRAFNTSTENELLPLHEEADICFELFGTPLEELAEFVGRRARFTRHFS